ncbi:MULTISPECIES: hypothetical protein [unclassified Mesorhizobium]|uniref:hypothetical protein n=1 Tax=unclassified Mesorhizobium TaxID=325217 RepID=UPI000F74D567|nr:MULTISPECIES: hypothetical protein [unclassified Mesorhizobium]RWF14114.1 MAG: hypothetical protein EOS64_28995 [Mesorhizobium sp.]AZO07978.1 hypothetical protein EJ074_01720 [Mesorhizobium sp. M3A.F.Ca.ET.080.04.2.1]TGP21510.1 hypothetical protein EN874_024575 [Mesorhizobium sp. M1D.F.Ca.ET.231.01.1.1]TGP28956.1 hypothetical protein EN877_22955 [Mesorhizobium sp. M1D.F.Ca.ET.234.01.1.1]TGS43425.1 hypothetical protein EN827_22950 [Mesorhizobium sp. M1D.F.Ca.ET.184.01.1.1]
MTELSGLAGAGAGGASGDLSRELDKELALRLQSLRMDPHASSDCFATSRPIIIEGLLWAAVGAAIWIGTLVVIGRGAL